MIEKHLDIPFIADLARREKQIQQNYRPVIAVHKWFARRPGTLFRGLILAEFSGRPLREVFYRANRFPGIQVGDPFMGGGTPLLEANRVGCDVMGVDINPMAYWIVKQEIEHLNLADYQRAAQRLRAELEAQVGRYYRTRCLLCGSPDAHAKYFLWVKQTTCELCGHEIDLFPGYLVAGNTRHPKNVLVCPVCGELTEADDRDNPGPCAHCGQALAIEGPAKRGRCACPQCGAVNAFPPPRSGSPRHRLFAIEYHCPACKDQHVGRFFKKPDGEDLARLAEVEAEWAMVNPSFVPEDLIPSGDETDRLHRWGYRLYREMFNTRQLLGLEQSARLVSQVGQERVRNALATNLSDLLRYQNMLCRYDTMALKSLDIFSVHGYPVGLIQCESNLLGIVDAKRAVCIGSGGWANIVDKFGKAKAYCHHPFEVRHDGQKKEVVPIEGEWIGDEPNGAHPGDRRKVQIACADAATLDLPEGSLDAVFTDPPYFGNVQYAELMDFCYVWLRRLVGATTPAFARASTRNTEELTGNENMGRGLDHFTEGLSAVFRNMARALKPGSPLALTYHHNDLRAYYPVAVAILDAGLACSACLPCPAEMEASIHISGTESSVIDTVFVCRSSGTISKRQLADTPEGVAALVREDLAKLEAGHIRPTLGDTRCIAYGHLIRLAVWHLRPGWDETRATAERMADIEDWLRKFGGWPEVGKCLKDVAPARRAQPELMLREEIEDSGSEDEISF
jgi:putative DNA methylase